MKRSSNFSYKTFIVSMICVIAGLTSCIHDNFDEPPVDSPDPNIQANISIADLKAMYSGTSLQITDTLIISGIVVADDKSGNFYKSVVIQDNTAGILIRMDQTNLYADYPVGRRIYVRLQGLWLGEYNGLIQIGGSATQSTINEVDYIPAPLFDDYIVKGSLNNPVIPILVTIPDLNNSFQNMLIRINDVQVTALDTGKTYANAQLQQSQNVLIEDCNDNEIILRNSGFADFAGQPLPNGKGTIVAVYSVFGNTRQLLIRDTSDLSMHSGPRCPEPYVYKNFEDASVTSGGWSVQQVIGPQVNWTTNSTGSQFGARYGQCSNYIGGNNIASETWLISPAMNLSNATNPVFSFYNACNYSGPQLQVLVSETYSGSGDPNAATWYTMPANLSAGSWAWVNSGNLPLFNFIPQNNPSAVYVAFKYTGTNSNGKTWEIDEIIVDEP